MDTAPSGQELPANRLNQRLAKKETAMLWMPSKHLGNLLLSLKALETFEKSAPGQTHLIIQDTWRDVMEASPLKSSITYYHRKQIDNAGLFGKILASLRFLHEVRQYRPSIAISLEGDKVSRNAIPFSGARWTVGPANSRHTRHFRERLPVGSEKPHAFYKFDTFVEQLTGLSALPGYPQLKPTSAAQKSVAARLDGALAFPNRPYAILHPCATKAYKQWSPSQFAALAEYLYGNGINTVITGAGDADGKTIAALQAQTTCPVVSLHDQLSIGELIALQSDACFFIGNDTGPTHLAAACGTKTLALFGPTREDIWGPMGKNVTIIRNPVACEPECNTRFCPVNRRCMRTLTLDDILPCIPTDEFFDS